MPGRLVLRAIRPSRALTVACLALSFLGGCQLFPTRPMRATDGLDTSTAVTGEPVALPGKNSLRRSQFVFYADFPFQQNSLLLDDLCDLREQLRDELKLPDGNSVIQVFIFENKAKYERYMQARYPELPRRRAFFIAQPQSRGGSDDLLVYTFWGDNIRQDLRHELTHAILHSVHKDVPLWLDEGLAEFFELPPDRDGINPTHLDQLRNPNLAADLDRLEKTSQIQKVMKDRSDYREAWAWVHLMLRSKPEARMVLLDYLRELRSTPNAGLIATRLRSVYPAENEALRQHLSRIDSGRVSRGQSPGK
jgi:hypothetical protein